ncbi:hypothetical protein [Streptomyces sp. AK08-02]|uniref:hypothetical protein n=1 Tax=Streptomyces sp. AK08-02 TaxID=3028654 RepID=UPI0029B8A96D|nr:hypothetical protein [Streptomyces sp. AK08-02]MDX3747822.1 hypothetical protein [Streptomyces sp. AK08-02]
MLHIPIPEPRDFAVLNADLTEIEPTERVNYFEECSDLGQLDIWARRAVGATSAEDLFVDGAV